jgi:hypothetical protein
MRRLVLPLAFAVIASGTARAEQDPASEPGIGRPIAIAVNSPQAWPWSVAFSAWVGLDRHNAIRANYARYRGPLAEFVLGRLLSDGLEEGDVPPDFGQTTDLSIGWAYYPKRVLDGVWVEVGALCRLNRLRSQIDSANMASEEQFTNVYSSRLLLGWTLRVSDWWFFSTGIGASVGYERGREKKVLGYDRGPITSDARVSRSDRSVEAYLRVGVAFGQ